MKYLLDLTEEIKKELELVLKQSLNKRGRDRLQAIVLSNKKYSISAISKILDYHRVTISLWIDNFKKKGVGFFRELSRTGRPHILTEEEENKVCQRISIDPRNLKKVQAWVKNSLKKDVSLDTLKRILKKKSMFGSECVSL